MTEGLAYFPPPTEAVETTVSAGIGVRVTRTESGLDVVDYRIDTAAIDANQPGHMFFPGNAVLRGATFLQQARSGRALLYLAEGWGFGAPAGADALNNWGYTISGALGGSVRIPHINNPAMFNGDAASLIWRQQAVDFVATANLLQGDCSGLALEFTPSSDMLIGYVKASIDVDVAARPGHPGYVYEIYDIDDPTNYILIGTSNVSTNFGTIETLPMLYSVLCEQGRKYAVCIRFVGPPNTATSATAIAYSSASNGPGFTNLPQYTPGNPRIIKASITPGGPLVPSTPNALTSGSVMPGWAFLDVYGVAGGVLISGNVSIVQDSIGTGGTTPPSDVNLRMSWQAAS